METALEIVGVRKVYRSDLLKGPQVAIDNLSLKFARGACTGLLGHNGAGKTTTIRLILGLIKPDMGQVLFQGEPLTTSAKRWIGYMPENNKLPAALTPDEILHHQVQLFAPENARSRADRKALVDAKLAEVELTEHRKKRIGHLSKGMARRLAWAQATIHEPKLLILDEPSSGLDPLARRQMLAWITAEKAKGTSILLCTHELAQVSSLCDDFHVLQKGKLVYSTAGDKPETDERTAYKIHVSGADEAALAKLAADAKLAPWQELTREGFLAVLGLADYTKATAWLGALLARGFVVTRFGDATFATEDEILQHFKGDR